MSNDSNPVEMGLEVEGDALRAGLQLLAGHAKAAKKSEAVLRFADGKLSIALGGVTANAPASGDWSGEARVSGVLILGLAKHPPKFSKLTIRVRGETLDLAGTLMACRWQPAGAAKLSLPMDATFLDILRLDVAQSDEELESSGMMGQVVRARERRDALIARAADVLAPLSICEVDLYYLVEYCIRRELRS